MNSLFLVIVTALLILLTIFQVILFFMGMISSRFPLHSCGYFCVGVKYLNDCPIQPNLPVYLLVVGSMGLVRALNLLWKQFRRRRMRKSEGVEIDQEEETENGSIDSITHLLIFALHLLDGSDFTDAVLNLFLFAWFIVGQFWTWPIYMPSFDFGLENPDHYCHKNVYVFTLVHIAFVYVMFLVFILLLIALTCCARFPNLIVKTPR